MNALLTVSSVLTGDTIQTYQATTPEQLGYVMASARTAAQHWGNLDIATRLKRLKPLSALILDELDNITAVIMSVTGKVKTEVLLGEIYPVLSLFDYYQRHAADILRPCPVQTEPLAFPKAYAHYSYQPYGVVAILSPWNFPWQLSFSPLLTALIAGNACVLKVSEYSIPVAELILKLLARLDLPQDLVQQVIGAGDVGTHLITARPDFVFFTGSVNTGRAVMTAAAQHPIPVLLELGGNDAMLVFADAHSERAVNALLYGSFSNSGQVCVSVERCLVQASIYDDFVARLQAAIAKLNVGHGSIGDLGAITTEAQLQRIQAHYDDALAKGAHASAPLTIEGRYCYPVLLTKVTPDMRVWHEETFGPLLPIMSFTSEQHAIELANASEFGLNASVWSQDLAKAQRVAQQLQVGNWAVNDVIKNIGHPGLPFGGVKNSGFGRYHGAEGLRQFCYTVAGLVSYQNLADEPNWFPYSDERYQQLKGFIDFMYGDGAFWQRGRRNYRELQAFKKYASLNLRQHWRNFMISWLAKR